jgi:hypothetical protein
MSEGPKIPIEITTTSGGNGIEETKQGLEELKGSVADLRAQEAASANDQEEQKKSVMGASREMNEAAKDQAEKTKAGHRASAEALSELLGKIKETGKEQASTNVDMRQFSGILRDLGLDEVAGGLENVTSVLDTMGVKIPLRFAGIAAAAVGVGLAIKTYLEDKANDVSVAMDQAADSMSGAMIATRSEAEEAGKMLKKAEGEARDLASELDEINAKAKRYNEIIAARSGDEIANVRANTKRQLDEVTLGEKEYEATGGKSGISPEKAAEQKAQIKKAGANDEFAIQEQKRAEQEKTFTDVSDKAWEAYHKAQAEAVDAQQEITKTIQDSKARAKAAANIEDEYSQVEKGLLYPDKQGMDRLNKKRNDLANAVKADNERIKTLEQKEADAKAKEAEARKFIDDINAANESKRTDNQFDRLGDMRSRDETIREAQVEFKTADFSRQAKERKEREAEEKKQKQERDKKESDDEKRREEEASLGRTALGLLPKGVSEDFARSVQQVAKGLQDGDQKGEIKELTKLMDELLSAMEKRGMKSEVALKHLAERIKKLENPGNPRR